MYSGKTHWVNWELAKVVEAGRVTNLILMIPEIKGWFRTKRTKEITARFAHVREVFKDTRWAEALAAFQDVQDARALLFGNDGKLVVIRSRPRNRDSYHLAALIAHFIILKRAVAS
jgi:hypothetical protein